MMKNKNQSMSKARLEEIFDKLIRDQEAKDEQEKQETGHSDSSYYAGFVNGAEAMLEAMKSEIQEAEDGKI